MYLQTIAWMVKKTILWNSWTRYRKSLHISLVQLFIVKFNWNNFKAHLNNVQIDKLSILTFSIRPRNFYIFNILIFIYIWYIQRMYIPRICIKDPVWSTNLYLNDIKFENMIRWPRKFEGIEVTISLIINRSPFSNSNNFSFKQVQTGWYKMFNIPLNKEIQMLRS